MKRIIKGFRSNMGIHDQSSDQNLSTAIHDLRSGRSGRGLDKGLPFSVPAVGLSLIEWILPPKIVAAFLSILAVSARSKTPSFRQIQILTIAGLVFLSGAFAPVSAQGCPSPHFLGAPNFNAGVSSPTSVAVSDFNGDGKTDLVVGAANGSIGSDPYISVFLGHGTGTFEAPVKLRVDVVLDFAVGDFDGDGNQDIAATSNNRHNVLVFLGDGSGRFEDPIEYNTLKDEPSGLVAGDLNGDGKADLIVADTAGTVSVFIANPSGRFYSPRLVNLLAFPNRITLGDFNGDAKPDFVWTSDSSLHIAMGDGEGSMRAPTTLPVKVTRNSSTPVIGDFNGDSNLDIVVTGDFTIFLPGNGAGGFGSAVTTQSVINVSVAADFNRDGKLDVAGLERLSTGAFRVGLGDGLGGFAEPTSAPAPGRIVVGDFNSDAIPDLASVNVIASDVSILIGDGMGGFQTGSNYPVARNNTGAPSVTTGDFNGDGKMDFAAVDWAADRVVILDGDGAGGFVFERAVDLLSSLTMAPTVATSGDFNHDGKSDVVALSTFNHQVAIVFGGPVLSVKAFDAPLATFIVSGDVNGDGNLDVLLTGNNGFLPGDGAGNLGPIHPFNLASASAGVAMADFNGDGRRDIALGQREGNTVSILLGDGANFNLVTTFAVGGASLHRAIAAADLNGDGKVDLAVTSEDFPQVSIVFGDGAGNFGSATDYIVEQGPQQIVAADFNGDGKVDLGVVNSRASNLSVLLNEGATGFSKRFNFNVGADSRSLAVADFNSDGRADLVASSSQGKDVTVLLSGPCKFPDVTITNSHEGDFAVGVTGRYGLKVSNVGLSRTTDPTVVTDILPAGLTFIAAAGTGWECSAVGQSVTCRHNSPFAPGESSLIGLSVIPDSTAVPQVINTVDVSNTGDVNLANNASTDSAVVGPGVSISGRLKDALGNALAGATVILSGAQKRMTTTDSTGGYSFSGLAEGFDYSVTPSKTACVFNPVNRVFNNLRSGGTADFVSRQQTNGKIVFTRNVGGNVDIYVMNADGSGVTQLTSDPAFDEWPAWSPDGKRIAFQRSDELYVMDADGNNVRKIMIGKGSKPVWSPDGLKIAFKKEEITAAGVYMINADGSNQQKVLSDRGDLGPTLSWSPDGSRIALSRSSDLYLMNLDGRFQSVLTSNNNTSDSDPDFSPDGSKLVYIAHDNNIRFDVATANVDGSDEHLISGAWIDASPSWSPDGAQIIFVCGFDICTMNSDGSNLTNITNSTFREGDPDWQPITQLAPVAANQIDDAAFFVRQQYLDFLNREPDASGLSFWINQITECQQPGATCSAEVRRINVSAAFFLSTEFQETGYLAYRAYKAAYRNLPGTPVPIKLNEFFSDAQKLGEGVIVGIPGWQEKLAENKASFAEDFVARSRFVNAYRTDMTPAQFVDALYLNTAITPSSDERAAAINEFRGAESSGDRPTRARALLRVVSNATFAQQERNAAFVLVQYFGYLRRNPDDAPEAGLNFDGYNFWLGKLEQFNGNFVNAEMVKAFLVSGEYRQRFGP